MCGIIGISSNKPVSASIISSLKKLEYRGYDSAGIATLFEGEIKEVKSEGRVESLEQNFDLKNLKGNIGIGHVRWATHCLLYTSDAADDMQCVDLGGRRIIKKKNMVLFNYTKFNIVKICDFICH